MKWILFIHFFFFFFFFFNLTMDHPSTYKLKKNNQIMVSTNNSTSSKWNSVVFGINKLVVSRCHELILFLVVL